MLGHSTVEQNIILVVLILWNDLGYGPLVSCNGRSHNRALRKFVFGENNNMKFDSPLHK